MVGIRTKGFLMSVQAYILIQSEIGSSEKVVVATRAVPGVLESFEVTGPYDVIVRCSKRAASTISGSSLSAPFKRSRASLVR
jgi:DNA-binding Lrp family transcriptional regulator